MSAPTGKLSLADRLWFAFVSSGANVLNLNSLAGQDGSGYRFLQRLRTTDEGSTTTSAEFAQVAEMCQHLLLARELMAFETASETARKRLLQSEPQWQSRRVAAIRYALQPERISLSQKTNVVLKLLTPARRAFIQTRRGAARAPRRDYVSPLTLETHVRASDNRRALSVERGLWHAYVNAVFVIVRDVSPDSGLALLRGWCGDKARPVAAFDANAETIASIYPLPYLCLEQMATLACLEATQRDGYLKLMANFGQHEWALQLAGLVDSYDRLLVAWEDESSDDSGVMRTLLPLPSPVAWFTSTVATPSEAAQVLASLSKSNA